MRGFTLSAFFIGIGLGMILSFFIINDITKSNPTIDIDRIPDEIVIQRAREIGLIDPYEGVYKDSIEEKQLKENSP